MTAEPNWWTNAIFYQIYPRSFADSDGDGVGDLHGVVDHLDHLSSLGVDAIWLNPVMVSPMADHGYDVADTRQEPRELWRIDLGGCIEATPAVWKGRVYFATRAGRFFALSDSGRKTSPTAGDARGSTGE